MQQSESFVFKYGSYPKRHSTINPLGNVGSVRCSVGVPYVPYKVMFRTVLNANIECQQSACLVRMIWVEDQHAQVQHWLTHAQAQVGPRSAKSRPKGGSKLAQSRCKVDQKSAKSQPKVGSKSIKSRVKVRQKSAQERPQSRPRSRPQSRP